MYRGSLSGKDFFFEQVQLGTGFFVFLLCALVFVEHILGTGAQLIAEGGQDVHFLLIFEEGASACFKVDAEHALVRLDFEDLDHADLSGCGWMCAAAGNAVRRVFDRTDADDGDILFDGERFAQRQLRRLGFCVEMAGDDRRIGPDRLIRTELCVLCHLPGERFEIRIFFEADVDGHVVVSHVEAAVDAAVFTVEHAAEDVLAAVALHVVKAMGPVDGKLDGVAALQCVRCAVDAVQDVVFVFVDIDDRQSVHGADITALTAAGREEDRLIQCDQHLAVVCGNCLHDSLTCFEINVLAE